MLVRIRTKRDGVWTITMKVATVPSVVSGDCRISSSTERNNGEGGDETSSLLSPRLAPKQCPANNGSLIRGLRGGLG